MTDHTRPVALDPNPPRYVTPVPSAALPEDDTQIPGPPPMPTGTASSPTEPSTLPPPSALDEIRGQLQSLTDAVLSPDGLLLSLFAGLEQRAKDRHEETMRTLTTIANGVSELSERLAQLEPEVERHDARLKLLALNGAE